MWNIVDYRISASLPLRLIGRCDLKSEGEEFRCAVFLDEHPKVRYWVRNVDRKPNAFWLQLPSNRFYPDFVAVLLDGRILVVEYKGKHLLEEARYKKIVGLQWAEASENKCLFVMPTTGELPAIDREIDRRRTL